MYEFKKQYQTDYYNKIKEMSSEDLLEEFAYQSLACSDTYGEYIYDEKHAVWKYHFLFDYVLNILKSINT